MLSKIERGLAADLLQLAADQFSNHGCNDYPLPDTPEHRALYRRVMKAVYGEDEEPNAPTGKIWFTDDSLMQYLSEALKVEAQAHTGTPPPMTLPVHLGDGAYASADGDRLVITANHHDPHRATGVVYLDESAIEMLWRLIEGRRTAP